MKNQKHLLIQKLTLVKKLNEGSWGYPNESVHLKEAEVILTDLLLKFPENTLVLTNMGALLCDLGKYEEAVSYPEKAIKMGSEDRNLYLNIGIALMNISGHARKMAKHYFEKAKISELNELSISAYFDPQGY